MHNPHSLIELWSLQDSFPSQLLQKQSWQIPSQDVFPGLPGCTNPIVLPRSYTSRWKKNEDGVDVSIPEESVQSQQ